MLEKKMAEESQRELANFEIDQVAGGDVSVTDCQVEREGPGGVYIYTMLDDIDNGP